MEVLNYKFLLGLFFVLSSIHILQSRVLDLTKETEVDLDNNKESNEASRRPVGVLARRRPIGALAKRIRNHILGMDKKKRSRVVKLAKKMKSRLVELAKKKDIKVVEMAKKIRSRVMELAKKKDIFETNGKRNDINDVPMPEQRRKGVVQITKERLREEFKECRSASDPRHCVGRKIACHLHHCRHQEHNPKRIILLRAAYVLCFKERSEKGCKSDCVVSHSVDLTGSLNYEWRKRLGEAGNLGGWTSFVKWLQERRSKKCHPEKAADEDEDEDATPGLPKHIDPICHINMTFVENLTLPCRENPMDTTCGQTPTTKCEEHGETNVEDHDYNNIPYCDVLHNHEEVTGSEIDSLSKCVDFKK